MKKINQVVQRIDSHYVGDDCVQVMFPYNEALTILNQDGMLFHHKPGSDVYVNKYLADERRKQFPYSNIPTHFSNIMFHKFAFANQLLDFEKPYIRIGDGFCSESYAVKDNNQALLINNIIKPDEYTKHMTYDEILKLIGKNNDEEQVFYVYPSGTLPSNEDMILPTEEEIHNHIKESLSRNVRAFEREANDPESSVGRYLRDNPWFLDYVAESMKDINYSAIDFDIKINNPILVVRINKGNIKIQCIEAMFIKENDYEVSINDIPVTKYTLEQLKYSPKIKISKEPRIPLRMNPGITKKDIKEAKQMVKTLKK